MGTVDCRIYEVDPLVCASCGGEMRILSSILDPAVVRKILDHLGDLYPCHHPFPESGRPSIRSYPLDEIKGSMHSRRNG